MTELSPARTRVAPSPTGDPHVGTAYQALFDFAWARRTGGQFVLRIEDTDRARLVEGSEQQIYDSLSWLGLEPDESPVAGGPYGPYRQSERLETYRPFVDQLLADGHAYHCWCTPERLAEMREQQQASKQATTGYDRLCHGKTAEQRAALPGFQPTPVVRMFVPDDVPLVFDDLIGGELSAPRPDDQVILKADGFPTYHLAVVVDDHLMGITHMVRGQEWISSTPKQILLHQWLGWQVPAFAHTPLIRNTDRSKLGKRKSPWAKLSWFREQGYLPEALLNFLMLLGHPPVHEGDDVQSLDEFVQHFDWSRINPAGAVFDLKKMDWLNGHYLRELSTEELTARIIEFEAARGRALDHNQRAVLSHAVPLVQPRMTLLGDALSAIEFLLTEDDQLTVAEDARASLPPNAGEVLAAAFTALEHLTDWDHEMIQANLREALVDGLGLKPKVAFAPVRVAIAGSKVSPPLFESMEILGRESSLRRLVGLRETL
ncbi:glutamate--tRNA ligase [Aestuariimicrobium kwangyangense]|uniref:glutamate--tRNA ligase n=1 Tax=Aestuariimicrobium kwangyangense TaxID=396389 RepID=UPI0004787ADD|nr:glutamate--tRNA ligase [Aestuariimicrobium kwangyangense]